MRELKLRGCVLRCDYCGLYQPYAISFDDPGMLEAFVASGHTANCRKCSKTVTVRKDNTSYTLQDPT